MGSRERESRVASSPLSLVKDRSRVSDGAERSRQAICLRVSRIPDLMLSHSALQVSAFVMYSGPRIEPSPKA